MLATHTHSYLSPLNIGSAEDISLLWQSNPSLPPG